MLGARYFVLRLIGSEEKGVGRGEKKWNREEWKGRGASRGKYLRCGVENMYHRSIILKLMGIWDPNLVHCGGRGTRPLACPFTINASQVSVGGPL